MIGSGELAKELGIRAVHKGVVFLETGEIGIALDIYFPASKLLTAEDRLRISEAFARISRQVLPIGGRARLYVEAVEGKFQLPQNFIDRLRQAKGPVREINQARVDAIAVQAAKGKARQWIATYTVIYRPGISKKPNESYLPEELESVLSEVQSVAQSTREILEAVGVEVRLLEDREILSFLARYFNPEFANADWSFNPEAHPLEQVLLSRVRNLQQNVIQVGNTYITHVVLRKGPRYTMPGALELVTKLRGDLVLVMEWFHKDQAAASVMLNTIRVRLENMAADLGNRADPEMREKAALMGKAFTRRAQTAEHILEVGAQIVLRDRNLGLLNARVMEAYGYLQTLPDALPIRQPPNAFEYWIYASPFFPKGFLARWHSLDLNAGDLVPIQLPWRGSPNPVAIYLSREGGVVGIAPFDPRAPSWNGLVIGGSGSGKTFFTQSYITSFLLEGQFVAIIDKGGGYIPLMRLLGGTIIELAPGKDIVINPFDLPEGVHEPDEVKKAFLVSLLKQMIPTRGDETKETVFLMAAVERVYRASLSVVMGPNGREQTFFRTPTLSDFRRMLETMDEAFGQGITDDDRALLDSMSNALSLWTGDRPYGQLVDGQTSIRLDNDLIYFETTGISQSEELRRVGLMLVIDLIWRRVARDPAEKKLLVMDEVWELLSNPSSARFIEDLYRRLRRYGGAALSVSQSLSDFATGFARGIVENANYLFLLNAPNQAGALKDLLKLPEDVINAYGSILPKKEVFFLMRAMGKYQGEFLRYEASGYELAAFGTQATEQVERKDLEESLGGIDAVARYKHLEHLLEELEAQGSDSR